MCSRVSRSSVWLGISALARGLIDTTSLVTATPLFDRLPLASFPEFVLGGHDIRRTSYLEGVRDLHKRSNVFNSALIESCRADLEQEAVGLEYRRELPL